MKVEKTDLLVIGAGPVGLMCAYLAKLSGISVVIVDQSDGPLQVGRADALNARTLQLLSLVYLFDELYPLGKKCNTSSVWANGQFVSRESSWWEKLEGALHKHFLMLGQAHIEQCLDQKLKKSNLAVKRLTEVKAIKLNETGCLTALSDGLKIQSQYVIGADGAHSFVRNYFKVPFEITKPKMIWAVIDGIIDTDFPKVSEIITFQRQTSDVAWIPREGDLDRFYIRMDQKEFTLDGVLAKINDAISPYQLRFKKVIWFSSFSVKESVAEAFFIKDRIFLAGDACHIHSVNGGQGLNTGLSDAFNLIWKLKMVLHYKAPKTLLSSYEKERKPVAYDVIKTSGELVRATKYSENKTHAKDYVKLIQKYAGNITGMGIRYGDKGLSGLRLFDFEVFKENKKMRLYSLLDYTKFTLLIFGEIKLQFSVLPYLNVINILSKKNDNDFWSDQTDYIQKAILVRPDSYIQLALPLDQMKPFTIF